MPRVQTSVRRRAYPLWWSMLKMHSMKYRIKKSVGRFMSEHTKTTTWGVQQIMLMKYYLMHNGECVESGVCHRPIEADIIILFTWISDTDSSIMVSPALHLYILRSRCRKFRRKGVSDIDSDSREGGGTCRLLMLLIVRRAILGSTWKRALLKFQEILVR